ncbi:MAG TPA: DUF4388 domain-containing protein [Bdellovibrionota bacterium]|nr:DUF4388 domain-containing protein [Bdellovibrionota bacterium]
MSLPAELTQGDFLKTPFPAVLWRLAGLKFTGVLEAKRGEVSKKIFLENGHPVSAESNLLHETIGKFLVEQKQITPEQEQSALVQSLEKGKPLGEILLSMGAIDPARLYESLQENLAGKILDVFSWDRGEFSAAEDTTFLERITPLKTATVRLILRGIESSFPLSRLEAEGFGKPGRTYRLVSKAPRDAEILQLTTEEVKALKTLKEGQTVESFATSQNVSEETARRRMYAFHLFGLLEEASAGTRELSLDELVGATLLQALKPVEPAKSVEKTDPETLALANEIASDHMKLMSLNYFELLGAEETATAVAIRDKFMEFAVRYSPSKFRAPALGEFRDRADEILLRGVKAFGTLSEFESKTKYIDKLKAERRKVEEGGKKKTAGGAFRIQTTLLDADSQFQKGMKFLKDKKYEKAVEFFQYAADIDARQAQYVAYLGWTTFQQSPERNVKAADELLRRARDIKPESDAAAYLLGKFLLAQNRQDEAMPHLKKAVELNPKDIDMVRELRNAERVKK